jgi:SsrA-binding protein
MDAKKPGTPTISNRKAYHDYHVLEELEAGIVLRGSEVKMVRRGSFTLQDSYCRIKDGELWLFASNIPVYPQAGTHELQEPLRNRKLLVHRAELRRLERKTREKGFTIVPLKAYFKEGKVKVVIGLVRGKKEYDKRETIKKKDVERDELREKGRRR